MTQISYVDKNITPDLLSIDFKTFKDRQIAILKNTTTFKDYNFEGSNISVILERHAYENEINTFYINKIAKNLYEDTVDLYENAHRIAKMKGYNAKGYNSSSGSVIINVFQKINNDPRKLWDIGDTLHIPVLSEVSTENNSGENIKFYVDNTYSFIIPDDPELRAGTDSSFSMAVGIRQGIKKTYSFTGKDIIDNTIVLPFLNFDHGDLNSNSVYLYVNKEAWKRVDDFFDGISGLKKYFDTNNVFGFYYDKFKRYIIEFSPFRAVPNEIDEIEVVLFETKGSSGNVGKNTISAPSENLVYNLSKDLYFPVEAIRVSNTIPTIGGSEPQGVVDVSTGGQANMYSQYRTVTSSDYELYIQARVDIDSAYVYGEQQVAPKGDTRLYNKIYITTIPSSWNIGTINYEDAFWTPVNFPREATIIKPIEYSELFKEDLLKYLEERKLINSYEEFVLPELIYFSLTIGVKVKRLYNFVDVCNNIRDKILFYFSAENRSFHEKISFMDLHNFILDLSDKTQVDDWPNIKGIENLVFRDIQVNSPEYEEGKNIYPPNKDNLYPQYTREEYINTYENKMKVIYLGFNQFPMINKDLISFEQEF